MVWHKPLATINTPAMQPKKYLYKLAQAVSKRCGISLATCQVVLPALFDEMRQTLCEGKYRCVTVESFGSFVVRQRPARHYKRIEKDGTTRLVELPSGLIVKFLPANNLKREVAESRFDPTHEAFSLFPGEHGIRVRKAIESKSKKRQKLFIGLDGMVEIDNPEDSKFRSRVVMGTKESER